MDTSPLLLHLRLSLLLLLLLLLFHRTLACNFGPYCLLPCRCADARGCDPDSGQCETGGCASTLPQSYGWGGYGCLTGNVAYNKTASQIAAHIANITRAGNAVDGRIATYIYGGSCAHPTGRNLYGNGTNYPAWWKVDLGETHYIINITLFNRQGSAERLGQLGLFVTNTSEVPQQYPTGPSFKLCRDVSTHVPDSQSRTFPCDTPSIGRYVIMYRDPDGLEPHFLQHCEFVAMGNRYIACDACSGTCTKRYGCVTCPAGKDPNTYCNSDCDDGNYGDGCSEECGSCSDGTVCDKQNGNCPKGCKTWWTNDQCKQEIETINFTSTHEMHLEIKSSSVQIKWPIINHEPNLSEYYFYRITLTNQGNPSKSIDTKQDSATIHDLTPNTHYMVKIYPYKKDRGQEEAGIHISESFKTKCVVPEKTTNFNVTAFLRESNSSVESIFASWDVPTASGCDRLTFVELIFERGGSSASVKLKINETEYIYTPQEEGTYYVYLLVYNNEDLFSEIKSEKLVIRMMNESTDMLGAILGGVVAAIVILVIVIIIIVIIKRRGSKKDQKEATANGKTGKDAGSKHVPTPPLDSVFSEIPMSKPLVPTTKPTKIERPSPKPINKKPAVSERPLPNPAPAYIPDDMGTPEVLYENADCFQTHLIKLADLERHVKEMKDSGKIKAEYEELPTGIQAKCDMAKHEKNKGLNRFNNIVAYDHSRVVLDVLPETNQTDYINACWITGYSSAKKAFIATQGPRPATVGDFWRMVWQTKSNRIVMLAQFLESGRRQCEEYWPLNINQSTTHDTLTVTTRTMDHYTDYTHSVIMVTDGSKPLKVHHFHYLSWPDKNVPESAFAMLNFHKRVRALDNTAKGPMIVHCSAGVGRTGTFVALDVLLQQAAVEGGVDVRACVRRLRQERMTMVQTLAQYNYVYEALVEHVLCGNTAIDCATFRTNLPQLKKDLPQTLKLLNTLKPSYDREQLTGYIPENRIKNRFSHILPRDGFRPYLTPRPGVYENYINAVFADSFTGREAFVVTQTPLPTTLSDFWRLVYDHDCKVIVMLDDADDPLKRYWPDGENGTETTHGPMKIKLVNTLDKDHERITIRDFEVSLNPQQSASRSSLVRQYQLRSWVQEAEGQPGLTEMTCDLLDLRDLLEKWRQQTGKGRVLVHCNDGAARCGVFVAASHVIDKMKVEHEVDVFLAARYITEKRPECIDRLDQLTMLYDMAAEYLHQYDEYANFQ